MKRAVVRRLLAVRLSLPELERRIWAFVDAQPSPRTCWLYVLVRELEEAPRR